jgi:hypothetical protein
VCDCDDFEWEGTAVRHSLADRERWAGSEVALDTDSETAALFRDAV